MGCTTAMATLAARAERLLPLGKTQPTPATAAKRPNLLFVFTDQQSFDMIGVENPQVISPNMDALAQHGLRFKHSVSNLPICSPYRGMMLTGKHPLHNGVIGNDCTLLTDGVSFGEALAQAGYRTGYVGKWHLYGGERNRGVPPGPHRHGFETFLSNNCHVDYRPQACFYWNDAGEKVFFKDIYPDHPWEVEAQTRQALDFLNDQDGTSPFALFVSWHPPHDWGMRTYDGVEQPEFRYDTDQSIPDIHKQYEGRSIRLRPGTEEGGALGKVRKEQYRHYMAMITGCDDALGQLINQLKKKGELDNTLIVFTSDHGDMLGSHNASRPKHVPQDYSARVPMIMCWKDHLPEGATTDLLIGAMDIMPTVLGLLRVPIPAGVQGQDLAPAILSGNEDAVESQPLFLLLSRGAYRGVYTKDWTYTRGVDGVSQYMGADVDVLYNRKDDPGQLKNLFNDPRYADVQNHLENLTRQWMDRFGDRRYTSAEFNQAARHSGVPWQQNKTVRPIDRMQKWIPRS